MKVQITINSENRIVVIPMEYDNKLDSLNLGEVQIEPIPDKNEDVSKDVVMNLAYTILSTLKGL